MILLSINVRDLQKVNYKALTELETRKLLIEDENIINFKSKDFFTFCLFTCGNASTWFYRDRGIKITLYRHVEDNHEKIPQSIYTKVTLVYA